MLPIETARSNSGPGNQLHVLAGGTALTDLIDQPGDNVFRLITLGFTATGTTTRIQFNGRNDPGGVFVDDVCVDATGGACGVVTPSGVPEPSSWLTACGLLALARWARKR